MDSKSVGRDPMSEINEVSKTGETSTLSVIRVEHPVIEHKMTQLRDRKTRLDDFRRLMEELSEVLAYEASRELELKSVEVETPVDVANGFQVKMAPVLVSVLRAGNGMLNGMARWLPFCPIGHIGMYRDKAENKIVEYFFRLPERVNGREIYLLDPMLATGETSSQAIARLKEEGVGRISLLTVLSSHDGIRKINQDHPEVRILTLAIDSQLDSFGYIVPGLGDAGDRLYGTV